jgi:nitrite reductase (NO-forming)
MYGLILVEPEKGLSHVDREYYVMQGEFYTKGKTMAQGPQAIDLAKLTAERPEYVVFNGKMGALTGEGAVRATVAETVRLFVGNGGPNLISSFHVIGEIFDTVYTEGALGGGMPARNVQTTLVPAGGASIVELTVQVPGRFLLVDHSIVRAMEKGALGVLEVAGGEQPGIFRTLVPGTHGTGGR